MEETTGNNSNRVASTYHSSKSASGQHAVLWSRRRRRAARSFRLRVSQVPGGALGAAPHEAVTEQQLADPGRAEPHLRALLQVRCQPRTCPAGERKAQLPRVLLHRLHQQLEVGRRDTRGPAGVGRRGQSFQATQAPTAPAVVDRARRHAQRLSDEAGALSLSTPQNDGRAQGLPPLPLTHCALELAPLGRCQFDATKIQAPCCFRYPPPGAPRWRPLNGFTLPGLAVRQDLHPLRCAAGAWLSWLWRLEPQHPAARGGSRAGARSSPAVGKPRCSRVARTPPVSFTYCTLNRPCAAERSRGSGPPTRGPSRRWARTPSRRSSCR